MPATQFKHAAAPEFDANVASGHFAQSLEETDPIPERYFPASQLTQLDWPEFA